MWYIISEHLNSTYTQDSKHSVNSIVYMDGEIQEFSHGYQNYDQKLGSRRNNW